MSCYAHPGGIKEAENGAGERCTMINSNHELVFDGLRTYIRLNPLVRRRLSNLHIKKHGGTMTRDDPVPTKLRGVIGFDQDFTNSKTRKLVDLPEALPKLKWIPVSKMPKLIPDFEEEDHLHDTLRDVAANRSFLLLYSATLDGSKGRTWETSIYFYVALGLSYPGVGVTFVMKPEHVINQNNSLPKFTDKTHAECDQIIICPPDEKDMPIPPPPQELFGRDYMDKFSFQVKVCSNPECRLLEKNSIKKKYTKYEDKYFDPDRQERSTFDDLKVPEGTFEKFKKCCGCFKTLYCSVTCQRAHWYAGHKQECNHKKNDKKKHEKKHKKKGKTKNGNYSWTSK